jgi:hypothetical protein
VDVSSLPRLPPAISHAVRPTPPPLADYLPRIESAALRMIDAAPAIDSAVERVSVFDPLRTILRSAAIVPKLSRSQLESGVRKLRQRATRVLIFLTYLIVPLGLLEYLATGRMLLTVIFTAPVVLALLSIRNKEGKLLFTVDKLRRRGCFRLKTVARQIGQAGERRIRGEVFEGCDAHRLDHFVCRPRRVCHHKDGKTLRWQSQQASKWPIRPARGNVWEIDRRERQGRPSPSRPAEAQLLR